MIIGTYKFRGAELLAACVQPIRLQVSIVPEPLLWFDALVWASEAAKDGNDGPLESIPVVRLHGSDALPQIEALLARQTRAFLASGADPAMPDGALAGLQIGASIAAMEEYLLTLPEFAGWVRA